MMNSVLLKVSRRLHRCEWWLTGVVCNAGTCKENCTANFACSYVGTGRGELGKMEEGRIRDCLRCINPSSTLPQKPKSGVSKKVSTQLLTLSVPVTCH